MIDTRRGWADIARCTGCTEDQCKQNCSENGDCEFALWVENAYKDKRAGDRSLISRCYAFNQASMSSPTCEPDVPSRGLLWTVWQKVSLCSPMAASNEACNCGSAPALNTDALCTVGGCCHGVCGTPVNCQVSGWVDDGTCSLSCGGGTKHQTRSITTAADHCFGDACPDLHQTIACNEFECPVDCEVSSWVDDGTCSSSCGGGTKDQTRSITTAADHGVACPDLHQTIACNLEDCPVDCVGGYTGACTADCGGGTKTFVVTQKAIGGNGCQEETPPPTCNTHACPVDCVGGYTEACTADCGGGTKTFVVTQEAQHGGNGCQEQTSPPTCNTHACPVDCVGGYTGACTADCGGGTKTFVVTQEAQHGGNGCQEQTPPPTCNTHACCVPSTIGVNVDVLMTDPTFAFNRDPLVQIIGDAVTIPNNPNTPGGGTNWGLQGKVFAEFHIYANTLTTEFYFGVEAKRGNPGGGDDSIYLQVDGGDRIRMNVYNAGFQIKRFGPFDLTPGLHKFYVLNREDGTFVRKVRFWKIRVDPSTVDCMFVDANYPNCDTCADDPSWATKKGNGLSKCDNKKANGACEDVRQLRLNGQTLAPTPAP